MAALNLIGSAFGAVKEALAPAQAVTDSICAAIFGSRAAVPAAKHFDIVMGIDIHLVIIPPSPSPIPMPHPYIGFIFDAMDYAPYIGSTVKVNGMCAGIAGTGGKTFHFPMGASFFPPPPGHDCEIFMGSSTVLADGEPFSRLGELVLTCQSFGMPPIPRLKIKTTRWAPSLPFGVVIPMPMGPPVLVGGPPTISLSVLAFKAIFKLVGWAFKKFLKKLKKWLKKSPECDKPGHPVDPVTGACTDRFVDFVASDGLPLRWVREYSSADAPRRGLLGPGFRTTLDREVTVLADGLRYVDEAGRVILLDQPEVGDWNWSQGLRLYREHEDRILLSRRGEPRMRFARDPDRRRLFRLVGLETDDTRAELEYDRAGRPARLEERTLRGTFETRFVYEAGLMSQVLRGRRGGQLNRVASYRYDASGCLIASEDALGGRWTYRYDAGLRLEEKTDPRGYTFRARYDASGRCVEETGHDGLWAVKLAYDTEARITRVTESDGGVWLWEYDAQGTVVKKTDPFGGVLKRETGPDGRILREIDPGGQVTEWLYGPDGDHTGRRDPFGHVLPPWDEDPKPPNPFAVVLPADARGFRLGQRRGDFALDLAVILPADVVARVSQAINPEASPPDEIGAPKRDALGHPLEELDVLGRRVPLEVDGCGNIVARVDRDGSRWRQEIIRWNLVGAEVDPEGRVTRFEYDPRENIAAIWDPVGNESRYTYDYRDRITSVTRHGRLKESYRWDAGDRLIEKLGSDGNWLVRYEVGANGLHKKRLLASGEVHTFDYDEAGHYTQASTRQAKVSLSRVGLGRRGHDLRDGVGVEHKRLGGRQVTTLLGCFEIRWTRNQDGTATLLTPEGSEHRLSLDAQGRTLVEVAGGFRMLLRFDAEGRCTGQAVWSPRNTAEDLWWATYETSPEGELQEARDSARGVTRYHYDGAHRLTGLTTSDGLTRSLAKDPAGNLLVAADGASLRYDEGNRLSTWGMTTFEYNARNAILATVDIDGTRTRYHYDSLDMLVGITWEGRSERWEAAYDGLGRRMWKRLGGALTQYWWDGDRVHAEEAPDGRLRIYIYADDDALSPLMFVDYPSVDAAPEVGVLFVIITDPSGLPQRIDRQDGRTVWRAARVHPYGMIEVDPSSEVGYDVRWPGHHHDPETGFHYNRFRVYSPTWGRYLQSDPMGQAGGINLYAYCPNPLVQVDVLGLAHSKSGNGDSNSNTKGRGKDNAHANAESASGSHSPSSNQARADARNAAMDRAGVPRDAVPDLEWEVGSDVTRRNTDGYFYTPDKGSHGNYAQYETPNGSRVIAEHTADGQPHFHAGQPKGDPARTGVDFGWSGDSSSAERYSQVGGRHHIYY